MSAAEWTREPAEWDMEVPENSAEEDDKLREYWSKKDRRRSSILKDFVGDSLSLRDNQRVCMYLAKFGKLVARFCLYVIQACRLDTLSSVKFPRRKSNPTPFSRRAIPRAVYVC